MATFFDDRDSNYFSYSTTDGAGLPGNYVPEREYPSRESRTTKPADDTMKEVRSNVPLHPIPKMQDAFAESMEEASNPPSINKTKHSAEVRR